MTETTHTPGPWTAQGYVVVALEADKIVLLPALTDIHTGDELRANARLIAAAPDLLAALKALSRGSCFCEMAIGNPMMSAHSAACEAAAAAIARAEGR